MTVFLIGLWIGGAVGALTVAMFVAGARADSHDEIAQPAILPSTPHRPF